MFGLFNKKKPKGFIDDIDANSLSLVISVLLFNSLVSYKKEDLSNLFIIFKNPENLVDFLISIELLKPLNDEYFLDLEHDLVKEQLSHYDNINNIVKTKI